MRQLLIALVALLALPAVAQAAPGPTVLPLPNGFRSEGIAIQNGFSYHGGSPDGSIFKINLRTGRGARIGPGPGTPALGLKIDHRGRIFVAGGRNGDFRVVDSRDGKILASYRLTDPPFLVNDVFVTDDAAYVTNSEQPVLYKLPLGKRGELPTQEQIVRLPLTDDIVWGSTGLNSNGITTTSDGKTLLMAQTNAGKIFRVDPRTGATTELDLGGEVLTWADGLLRIGRTLYVVQNRLSMIAELRLNHDETAATLVRKITDPSFDVPTNVVAHKGRLYLPNARLTTPQTPETPYNVVSIPRPRRNDLLLSRVTSVA